MGTETDTKRKSAASSNVWLEVFKPPFAYDKNGAMIWDSENTRVLDCRGWGHLTGTGGGLGLSEQKACELQDSFGEWVVETLNEAIPSNKRITS